MNEEVQFLLEKQAHWQSLRRDLSWPEKIRMAEMVRESARQLRRPQPAEPRKPPTDTPSPH